MNQPITTLDQIKSTLLDLAIRFGPKLLVASLILILGLGVSRWVSRWFLRILSRVELEPPVRTLLARVVWAICASLFVILALQNLGVELLPLIAGLSVVGAGIALATQGVLSNLVAGLSIIFGKPFRVGEYISILGQEGMVSTISLFSTTLTHADRSRVVIPNRKIAGEIFQNFGNIRQLEIVVGVAYESDLKSVVATINQVLQTAPVVEAMRSTPASCNPFAARAFSCHFRSARCASSGLPKRLFALSNSNRRFCDLAHTKRSYKRLRRLKNPPGDPIKTWNVSPVRLTRIGHKLRPQRAGG